MVQGLQYIVHCYLLHHTIHTRGDAFRQKYYTTTMVLICHNLLFSSHGAMEKEIWIINWASGKLLCLYTFKSHRGHCPYIHEVLHVVPKRTYHDIEHFC